MTRFEEIVERVLRAGHRLTTAGVTFHTAVSTHAGLSSTESKAVEIIERRGPLTSGELARESGLAPASVTALLDRLAHKGVARRTAHPHDKRRVLVEVEPAFREATAALLAASDADLREMCAGYAHAELEVIERFLDEAAECRHRAAAELTG